MWVCFSIKYSFLISLRFWQQILFLWQKNFYWLFQIKFFCKILFGSASDDSLVELENSVHWQSLTLYFLLFPLALRVLFSYRKKWLIYLLHAISPYVHGKLINWTSPFYLSLCSTVLARMLNIIIFIWQLLFLYNFTSHGICANFGNQQIYYLINIYFLVVCLRQQKSVVTW